MDNFGGLKFERETLPASEENGFVIKRSDGTLSEVLGSEERVCRVIRDVPVDVWNDVFNIVLATQNHTELVCFLDIDEEYPDFGDLKILSLADAEPGVVEPPYSAEALRACAELVARVRAGFKAWLAEKGHVPPPPARKAREMPLNPREELGPSMLEIPILDTKPPEKVVVEKMVGADKFAVLRRELELEVARENYDREFAEYDQERAEWSKFGNALRDFLMSRQVLCFWDRSASKSVNLRFHRADEDDALALIEEFVTNYTGPTDGMYEFKLGSRKRSEVTGITKKGYVLEMCKR